MSWLDWTRNRRNLPTINYAEDSEEEDLEEGLNFDSPLTSPRRPHQSPSVSPRALLQPDPPPTEEVLNSVQIKLEELPVKSEEVDEGHVVGHPVVGVSEAENPAAAMPDDDAVAPPKYEAATGNDEADVYKKLSTLKSPFTTDDPKFWFNNFERTIKHFGIKSQTTKYEALINQLPKEVTDEVKSILSTDEEELGDTPYLTLKTELLSLYSPRPEDAYAKAVSRVLTGKPSSLGKLILNDMCDCPRKLQCKCCIF